MIDKLTEMKNKLSETLLPTKMFNEDFRAHIALVRKTVTEDKIKSFMPRMIVTYIADDGPSKRGMAIIGLAELPETNPEKQALMSMMGLACAANDLKVVMAVFESEAWIAKQDPGPDGKLPKDMVPPSERPDRKEGILVAARTIDGRDAFATVFIVDRGPDKELILGEEKVTEFGETREGTIEDSLLTSFFRSMALATMGKLEAETLMAQGKEVPEDLQKLVLLMDSCPIKIK